LWLKEAEHQQVPAFKYAMETFPYKTDEFGVCEKFISEGDNPGCSVYEDRPLLCNSDKMALLMEMHPSELYKLNAIMCNYMIRAAGLPASYLIDEDQFDRSATE
jgi:Fe-S-cluster containining protein